MQDVIGKGPVGKKVR